MINEKSEAVKYIKELKTTIAENSAKIAELSRINRDLEDEAERFQNKFNISDEEIV